MKKAYILTAAFLLIAAVISSVSAFGIAMPYWKENPLIMQPGEAKDVALELQNMVGNSDLTIRVELLEGSDIATLTDSSMDYLVRKGTADTNVNLRVSIPSDEAIGTKHTITFSFSTVTSGATATGVKVGTSIEKSVDVITGEVKEKGIETWMWVVAVVAILIILILLIKPKKKAAKRRR